MNNLKYLFFLLLLANAIVFLWSLRSGDVVVSNKAVVNINAGEKQIKLVSELTESELQQRAEMIELAESAKQEKAAIEKRQADQRAAAKWRAQQQAIEKQRLEKQVVEKLQMEQLTVDTLPQAEQALAPTVDKQQIVQEPVQSIENTVETINSEVDIPADDGQDIPISNLPLGN